MYPDPLRGSVSPHSSGCSVFGLRLCPPWTNAGSTGALAGARRSAFSLTSSAAAGSARRLRVTQSGGQQLASLADVWGGERGRVLEVSPIVSPGGKKTSFKRCPRGAGEGEDAAGVSQLGLPRAAL